MVTVPHKMIGLERMLDYRGVGLQIFHCMLVHICTYVRMYIGHYRIRSKFRHSNFSSGTMNQYFLTLMLTNVWRSNFRHFTLIFVIDQKQSNHLSQRALFLDFVDSASISVC